MKIEILQLLTGAEKAEGLTVVIDVFRAFSLACYLADKGVSKIIPLDDLNKAYNLKKENNNLILIGERDGRMVAGCDYGNSPSQIENENLDGKIVIHTTSAGTQGIYRANKAKEIITGSFVNAGAVAKYILKNNFEKISLLCMGEAGIKEAEEDILCAEYIENLILGKENDEDSIINKLKIGNGRRFFDKNNADWSPEKDFYMCLDFNRFNFILKVYDDIDNMKYLKRIDL